MIVIFNQDSTKMLILPSEQEILHKKVGIDVGYSLSKIAFVDENDLILSIFPTKRSSTIISEYLEKNTSNFEIVNLTGGKAYDFFKKYEQFYQCKLIDEFEANVKGMEFIFQKKKKKPLPPSLIVMIGTGTSFVLKKETFTHIGGTALGGGFFMGISKLLYDIDDYHKAIELAKKGNRYNIDLKVNDIYSSNDKRVSEIFREFTASSFGKIDSELNSESIRVEDILNSIINLIGENIGLLTAFNAQNHDINFIVYGGGFTIQNDVLNKILKIISKYNGLRSIFLKNSEYCGAIGALLI